jgi:enterochelin esterase-like enzyme
MIKKTILFLDSLIIFANAFGQINPYYPKVSNGTLKQIENFPSKYVSPRNVDIWLPEGYNENEKYAVLYMQDGQMLFDSTITWNKQEWGVDETISKLLRENKIRKTIVVGIWNTKDRHSEYFPQKPFESLPAFYQDSLLNYAKGNTGTPIFTTTVQSDNYLKFLVEELKPFIDMNYSTNKDAENTFIAGSSMGGLISIYGICEYPDIFGGAACLSTHWTGTYTDKNNPIPGKIIEYLKENLPDPSTHKIYFDYGTETLDTLYEKYQKQVDSVMVGKGFTNKNWITLKFEGENHSEKSWAKRLDIPLVFLLSNNKHYVK